MTTMVLPVIVAIPMVRKKFKTIGVLGGIGPVATAHFFQVLLQHAQSKYLAVQDYEYPHIIVNSVPYSETSEIGIEGDEELLLDQMKNEAMRLKHMGAEVIAVPCNTVHTFIAELSEYISLEIINLVNEVVKKVKEGGSRYGAVLGSKYTHSSRLYYEALDHYNIKYCHPDRETIERTAALIQDVMGGKTAGKNKDRLLEEINRMKTLNIDGVILGCTELPVALKQEDTDVKLYDSVDILAEATLNAAYVGQNPYLISAISQE